ncbi:MAG: LysR family transcriptional regulator [Desulfotalea sp.]
MLNHIDFNRLKVFYYIYRQKSLTSASKCLNISPSAISQQLKKLEEELNITLFTRIHKKLIPTQEAKTLYKSIEPFINNLKINIREFEMGKEKPSGTIRLGSATEFGKFYLPKMIASFQKQYPNVRFELYLSNSDQILAELKAGNLNFAIMDVYHSKHGIIDKLVFNAEPVVDERFLLACSTEYFQENIKGKIDFAELRDKKYIAYDENYRNLRTWFSHHYGKQISKITTSLVVDNVQAVVTGVESGLGLGVVTCHSISDAVARGTVQVIKTGKEDFVNRISIVQLQDKMPSLTEKKLIKHIRACCDKIEVTRF